MTPEEKKTNWQRAHDLHYLRHRSGLSLVVLAGALGVDDKVLRKMERNKIMIADQFLVSAEMAVRTWTDAGLIGGPPSTDGEQKI